MTTVLTHIVIVERGTSPSGKTRRWLVMNKHDPEPHVIGKIEWYARWRKYVFAPEPMTVFEEVCLRELAGFVEERTREQRTAKAQGRID